MIPRILRSRWAIKSFRFIGLGAWATGTTIAIACLMASHWIALPSGAAMVRGNPPGGQVDAGPWRAIHVLAEGCPCSAAVADYLQGRGLAEGLDETVVIAGDGNQLRPRLIAAGFTVRSMTAEQLLKDLPVAVRGGPWLILLGPDGRVAYSGGYGDQRPQAGVVMQDLAMLRRLRAGERVLPLPAFGCAIDTELKRALDPLGLK